MNVTLIILKGNRFDCVKNSIDPSYNTSLQNRILYTLIVQMQWKLNENFYNNSFFFAFALPIQTSKNFNGSYVYNHQMEDQ